VEAKASRELPGTKATRAIRATKAIVVFKECRGNGASKECPAHEECLERRATRVTKAIPASCGAARGTA
jgi:hypothetical protein